MDDFAQGVVQDFGVGDERREVEGLRELVDVLEDLVKLAEVPDDDVPVRLEDGERKEVMEVRSEVIGEEDLPQLDRVVEREFALERGQEPAEAEEEVERAGRLCRSPTVSALGSNARQDWSASTHQSDGTVRGP